MSSLSPKERAWAAAIFEAIVGDTPANGLPAFDPAMSDELFAIVDRAGAPQFRMGLRAMVVAFDLMPLATPGYGKRFHSLDRARREAFVTRIAADDRYVPRQLFSALKMMACFAYFDVPSVRARFEPENAS